MDGATPAPQEDTSRVPQTGDPLIASASIDGDLKFWRLTTGMTKHKSVQVHQGAIWAVTDLGDGRVASGGKDQLLRMWDLVSNGDLAQEIKPESADPIASLQPLWGGQLAVGHASGTIRVYSIGDGAVQEGLRFVKVAAVVAEATGQRVNDGGLVATLSGHSATVNALCAVEVAPEAGRPLRRLLVSGSDDKKVCVWDSASKALQATITTEALVYAVVDLGGGLICAGLQSGALQVWDVGTSDLVTTVPKAHGGLWVKALCLWPAGGGIVSGGGDCCVRTWRWDAGKRELEPAGEPMKGHTKAVTAVYADPDGWILSGGGPSVRVWGRQGIPDGTVIRKHGAMVTSITPVVQRDDDMPSPNGAAVAADGTEPGSVYRKRRDGARIPAFAFS